jgi:hypothetical protein
MARTLELSLMASGDTIDLPLEQLVALIYVTTPNATEPSINECTIKDNTIIYDVLPIVEEGITEMQIKLIDTRVSGANGVLPTPKFAVEVTSSNTNDDSAIQTTTYTALENAIASAKSVYDERFLRIELDSNCMFRAYYADGTVYETDVLKELFLKGEALLSQSYARGGTGVRTGEDTDNSMYYSNVSKSASAEANKIREESSELFDEIRRYSVYTVFSVDFETGEMKYSSPNFSFNVNKETGELDVLGDSFTPDANIELIVTEYLKAQMADIKSIESDVDSLKSNTNSLKTNVDTLKTNVKTLQTHVGSIASDTESLGNNIESLGNLVSKLPISNGGTGAITVKEARENLGVAEAYEHNQYRGCYYRMVNGEQEWINPPMIIDVEYRTTERMHGYTVYTMLMRLAAETVGDGKTEMSFPCQLGANTIVFKTEAWTSSYVLPHRIREDAYYQIVETRTDDVVIYKQGSSVKAQNIWIRIWYYKK